MKLLVTGSTGLIGSQVIKDLCAEDQTVFSCYHEEPPQYGIPIPLDLTNLEKIEGIIQRIKPDRIIHLAAMTNVDLCEIQKEKATLINEKATKIIAEQSAKQNIFFVYVSTDYVFDGICGMRKENDSPNPLGFYGKSKLAGELAINYLASPSCIVRTSTPFGLHSKKKSFPIWVKENLEAKNEIKVLVDQFTSPTYVPNLSKMLIEVTTREITGTLHLAGATRISRYEFAKKIADKFNLDHLFLKPAIMADLKWKSPRPYDSSLDVSIATEILKEKPQKIEESLDLFCSHFKSQI